MLFLFFITAASACYSFHCLQLVSIHSINSTACLEV